MWLSLVKFALRDFRVNRIILPNVTVVIQLSRACGRPSLRLDILQAHSGHSSLSYRSMVLEVVEVEIEVFVFHFDGLTFFDTDDEVVVFGFCGEVEW
ncbi:hypothetical protein [Rubritalea tangerina]|uniref:hypothetical protein n=1 Tax=Rubritalea tangerina TaxID=430798 RepID=UPI0036220125